MIGLSMLSLAGIPPLPGFIGKFLIFKNVIANGYTFWAVLGLIGSYIGIYFYIRVIQLMFMNARDETPQAVITRRAAFGATLVCLVPAVLVAVLPGWFISLF
jgi:NADH-quinone oxidoreductase subunit N